MRSTPVRLGVLSLLAAFVSCTSESTPIVYIGMQYQVRCLDCQPREPDPNPRDIRVVDGEDGHSLECSVNSSGGVRRVSFSAEHQSTDPARKYVLSVKGGRLGGDESDGPCEVRVIEGENTYVSPCGTDEPTTERPCQVSFRERNGVIKGGLYCDKMVGQAGLEYVRYLVAPYTNEDPAEFELYGCAGL